MDCDMGGGEDSLIEIDLIVMIKDAIFALMSKELKVTGLTKVPASYKGEPCVMTIIIGDVRGDFYEAEIHFDEGLKADKLLEAAHQSFKMMDAMPASVNVQSFRIKKNKQ